MLVIFLAVRFLAVRFFGYGQNMLCPPGSVKYGRHSVGVSTQFELNRRKALRHPLNGQQLGVARRQLGVRRQFNHLIAGKDLGDAEL